MLSSKGKETVSSKKSKPKPAKGKGSSGPRKNQSGQQRQQKPASTQVAHKISTGPTVPSSAKAASNSALVSRPSSSPEQKPSIRIETDVPSPSPAPTVNAWSKRPVLAVLADQVFAEQEQLPVTKPPAELDTSRVTKLRGIVNPMNTCFANATFQVLFHLESFVKACQQLPGSDLLQKAVLALAHELQQDGRPVSAELVTSIVRSFGRGYGRQQDAHEFLNWLLNTLHESSAGSEVEAETEAEAEKTPEPSWEQVGRRNQAMKVLTKKQTVTSTFQAVFQGSLESVVRRKNGVPTISLDHFLTLPIEISGRASLEEGLDDMFASEKIHGDAQVTSRQYFLASLPPVLVLPLKRFRFDGKKMVKEDAPANFPTELDLHQYVSKASDLDASEARYRLYAIVHHYGRLDSGHYIASVLVNSTWMNFDDSSVRPEAPNFLDRARVSAYLLVYTRAQ